MSFEEDTGLREIRPTAEGIVRDLLETAKEIAKTAAEEKLQIRISAWADGSVDIRIQAPGRNRFIECGSWDGKDYFNEGRNTDSGGVVASGISPGDISFDALRGEEKREPWKPRDRNRIRY